MKWRKTHSALSSAAMAVKRRIYKCIRDEPAHELHVRQIFTNVLVHYVKTKSKNRRRRNKTKQTIEARLSALTGNGKREKLNSFFFFCSSIQPSMRSSLLLLPLPLLYDDMHISFAIAIVKSDLFFRFAAAAARDTRTYIASFADICVCMCVLCDCAYSQQPVIEREWVQWASRYGHRTQIHSHSHTHETVDNRRFTIHYNICLRRCFHFNLPSGRELINYIYKLRCTHTLGRKNTQTLGDGRMDEDGQTNIQ